MRNIRGTGNNRGRQLGRILTLMLSLCLILSSVMPAAAYNDEVMDTPSGTGAEYESDGTQAEEEAASQRREDAASEDNESASGEDSASPDSSVRSDKKRADADSQTGAEDKKSSESDDIKLVQRSIRVNGADGDKLTISGKLPQSAVAEAQPADVSIDGQRVLLAYDISIYASESDRDRGTEWQPEEALDVKVTSAALAEAGGSLNVYHMEDEKSEPELIAETDVNKNSVEFEAESFSVYAFTVEFTYDGRQYVLNGSDTVRLDKVLASIGIEGTIKDAEVSDSTKFEANWNKYDGHWYIYALQPFDTQEWMKVTMDDDTQYEIAVTDAFYPVSGGSDKKDFASAADIGTIAVEDLTGVTPTVSFSEGGDWSENGSGNGQLGWKGNLGINDTKLVKGTAKVRYAGAATTADGTLCDVELVFSDAVLYGSDDGQSTDFHRIIDVQTGRLPQVYAFTSNVKFGLKVTTTIHVYKAGTDTPVSGSFFASIYGVNVVRTNQSAAHIVDYNTNNHYTETIEIDGSKYDVYYNSDGLTRNGNRIYPPDQKSSGTYDTGIVIHAEDGVTYTAYQYAPDNNGTNLQLMPRGGINHTITSYSGSGGSIATSTTGKADDIVEDSAKYLDGGRVGDQRTYVVPTGKQVAYKMTPKSGYTVKEIYVDGTKIELGDSHLTPDGTSYVYTFTAVGTTHKINVQWEPAEDPKLQLGHIAMEPGENGAVTHTNLQNEVPTTHPTHTTLPKDGSAVKMGEGAKTENGTDRVKPPEIDGYTLFTYALGAPVDEEGNIPAVYYAKSDDLGLRFSSNGEYQYCVNYTGGDSDVWETWTLKDESGEIIPPTVYAVYTRDDTDKKHTVYTAATAIARNATDADFVDPAMDISFTETIKRVTYTITVKNPNSAAWNAETDVTVTTSESDVLAANTHTHKPGEAHGHALEYMTDSKTIQPDDTGDLTFTVHADYMTVEETAPANYSLTSIDKKHGARGTESIADDNQSGTFTIYTAGTTADAGYTVERSGNSTDGYTFTVRPSNAPKNTEVEFINTRKTVPLTVQEILKDGSIAAGTEHPFSITIRAREQWSDGREHYSMLGTHTISPKNLDDDGALQTIEVPVNADILLIQRFGVTNESTGVKTTDYDTIATSEPSGIHDYRPVDKEYILAPITAATTVTLTNQLKPRIITVKKNLIGGDLSKHFNFTARITKGSNAISEYSVYTDEAGNEQKTDGQGSVAFTLSGNDSIDLRAPYGSTVIIGEEEGDDYSTSFSVDNGAAVQVDAEHHKAVINENTEAGITKNHEVVFTNTADFSVHPEEGTVTYEFYMDEGFSQKYEYTLASNSDENKKTHRQILRNGSVLVLPEQPAATGDNEGKTFMGWFHSDGTEEINFGKSVVLDGSTPDADEFTASASDEPIKLYAKFADVRYVVFHENQTTDEDNNLYWPVMETVAVEKNSEDKYVIDLSQYKPVVEDTHREFVAWANTAENAIDGTRIPETGYTSYEIDSNKIDLYPVFHQKVRVSFWTGETGSGAPYVQTALINKDAKLSEALPADPQWKGYQFKGWYKDRNLENELTDEDLATQDTTLYARWEAVEKAQYTVALWKMKSSAPMGVMFDKNNYDFVSVSYQEAETYTNKSFTDSEARNLFNGTDFTGFHFNFSEEREIRPEGDTVINVFYDRNVLTVNIKPVTESPGYKSGTATYSGKKVTGYVEATNFNTKLYGTYSDKPADQLTDADMFPVTMQQIGWLATDDKTNYNNLAIPVGDEGMYLISGDGYPIYPLSVTAYSTYRYNTGSQVSPPLAQGGAAYLSANELGYQGTAQFQETYTYYATGDLLHLRPLTGTRTVTDRCRLPVQAFYYYVKDTEYSSNPEIYWYNTSWSNVKLYNKAADIVGSMSGYYGSPLSWPQEELRKEGDTTTVFQYVYNSATNTTNNSTWANVTPLANYIFSRISNGKSSAGVRQINKDDSNLDDDGAEWTVYVRDVNVSDLPWFMHYYKLPAGETITSYQSKITAGEVTPDVVAYYTAINTGNNITINGVSQVWPGYSLYQYQSMNGTTGTGSANVMVSWRAAYSTTSTTTNKINVYENGGNVTFKTLTEDQYYTSTSNGVTTKSYRNAVGKTGVTPTSLRTQMFFVPLLQNVIFKPYGVDDSTEYTLKAYTDNVLSYTLDGSESTYYKDFIKYLNAVDANGDPAPQSPASGHAAYTVAGRVFAGWYMDAEYTIPFDPDTTVITDTTYVYGKWEKPWYVVQVDPAGGSLTGDESGSTWFWRQHGDTISSYDNVIRRDYDEYEDGEFYYHKYEYVANGGTFDEDKDKASGNSVNSLTRTATYDKNDSLPNDGNHYRQMPGIWQLKSWDYQTSSDGENWSYVQHMYTFGTPVTSHLKLIAVWEKVAPFKIVYDVADGTLIDNPSPSNALYGDADNSSVYMDGANVTITKSAKSNDPNKQFLGWKVKGGDTAIYPLNSTYSVSSHDADTNMIITLVAQYGQMDLTSLRYDANGGEGTLTDVTATENSTQLWDEDSNTLLSIERNDTVKLSGGEGFTRDGYQIVGWSEKPVEPEHWSDYYAYNATSHTYKLKTDANSDRYFELGQNVVVDGATGNELFAVWKKGGLTIKAFTYENGSWQTAEKIHGGTYLDTSNGDTPRTPEDLAAEYNGTGSDAKYTLPAGYIFAFGKVNGTTVKQLKYAVGTDGQEWQYSTDGNSWSAVGENSLDIYYGKTVELTITKTVTGSYADMSADYGFEVTLPDMDSQSYDAKKYASDSDTDPSIMQLGKNDSGTIKSFSLKNGERLVIIGIPQDKEITVSENGDNIGSADGNDGRYQAAAAITGSCTDWNTSDNGKTAKFKLQSDAAVTFTNTLNNIPITGLFGNSRAGMIVVLLAIMLAGAMYCSIRAKRRRARG